MPTASIIQRRDLQPLWVRAKEMAQHYERAGNCITSVMGADYISVEMSKNPKSVLFCSLCKRYNEDAWKLPSHDVPCSEMHRDAVKEARKAGGSLIYSCPLGFLHWTSPFFSGERFAGAFLSGGFISPKRNEVRDRIFNVCHEEISRAEIDHYLEGIPEKNSEDLKALAQMMLLCAEKISSTKDQYDGFTGIDREQEQTDCQPHLRDSERQLVACLRRGDSAEAKNIARDIVKDFCALNYGDLETLKLQTIEMVTLLSRTGVNEETKEEFTEVNGRNLKRINDSKTVTELADNLCVIVERMVGKYFSFQGIRHSSALRKAERYIWDNYTRKLSLKEIADVSGLSAPYFSTIFKEEMGENLSNYLNRLRVEKALVMLRETEDPINKISAICGFEDQSWFSKIFKCYTGITPYEYRKHGGSIKLEYYGQKKMTGEV